MRRASTFLGWTCFSPCLAYIFGSFLGPCIFRFVCYKDISFVLQISVVYVSALWLYICLILPLILSAFLLHLKAHNFLFVYLVLHSVFSTYLGCYVVTGYSAAGWMMWLLFMAPNLLSAVVTLLYVFFALTSAYKKQLLLTASLLAITFIWAVDLYWISPLLMTLSV